MKKKIVVNVLSSFRLHELNDYVHYTNSLKFTLEKHLFLLPPVSEPEHHILRQGARRK